MLVNARDCWVPWGQGAFFSLAFFGDFMVCMSWHLILVLLVAQGFMCVVIGMWFFLSGRS